MPIVEAARPTRIAQAGLIADTLRQHGGDYGVGKPKAMCMPTLKTTLGPDAIDITRRGLGRVSSEEIISPQTPESVSLEEAVRNSYAFMQIFGVSATNEAQSVASISTGLPWDRQSPMEDTVREIIGMIAQGQGAIYSFGGDKLLLIIENDEPPEQLLKRFVQAPKKPYRDNLPHLADAVEQMQEIRKHELLDSNSTNAQFFLNTFYGRGPQVGRRAHQDDGKYSFVFDYENRGSDGLHGINLDGARQRLTELGIDDPTKAMLQMIEDFFIQKPNGLNRYIIEFDFSATVSCCNTSFNAQHSTSWENDALSAFAQSLSSGEEFSILSQNRLMYPNGETYTQEDFCKNCHKNKKEGECKCEEKHE